MANRTTFTEISDGDELSEGYFNGISGFLAPPLIRNLIRQLQNRSVVFSADGGEWAEAYTDSNGRLNSVASATAFYNSLEEKVVAGVDDEASGDTTSDPNSFTNPSYAFDGDRTTYARKTIDGGSRSWSLGKTFTAKNVNLVQYRVAGKVGGGSFHTIKMQTYDGATWNDETTVGYGAETSLQYYEDSYELNSSVEGVRFLFTGDGHASGTLDFRVLNITYGDMADNTVVTHDLPSGSFSSTISSCFGSALVADWETGANIQYKLTNATSDTGWLTYNEVSSFTAFASEPTTCIVKLIPKTTSPTTGYPSIKGFAVYE